MRSRVILKLTMKQDWGLSFPEKSLDAVKQKNLLKRFATVEVSSVCLPTGHS